MARITEIQPARAAARAPPPPPTASRLLLLASIPLSFLFGVLIHIWGVHMVPGTFLPNFTSLSTSQMEASLGWHRYRAYFSWIARLTPPGSAAEKLLHEFGRVGLVLIAFFRDMFQEKAGVGLLCMLLAGGGSLTSLIFLESVKPKTRLRNPLALSIPALVLTASLGQLIMFGSAMNLLFLPAYAWGRYRQSTTSRPLIHPSPSASESATWAVTLVSNLAFGMSVLTCFVPISSEWWVLSNVIFQFFPLGWLPALLIPTEDARSPKHQLRSTASAAEVQEQRTPRLAAANAYSRISHALMALYLGGFYLAFPGLASHLRSWRNGETKPHLASSLAGWDAAADSVRSSTPLLPKPPMAWLRGAWRLGMTRAWLPVMASDGVHLLFWDLVGVVGCCALVVLVDRWADELALYHAARRVEEPGAGRDGGSEAESKQNRLEVPMQPRRRVHDQRVFLADVLAGAPVALLLGPGWGLCRYLQRRETMAERARFRALGYVVEVDKDE